jgi:hypothetical protein
LTAEDLVHRLALGQHVVQRHVADDRPQRGRGDVLGRAGEVADLDHRHPGVHDPVEDDEVDRDRRVVLGDRGLVRDLQVQLAEVDPDALVHERDEQDQPGPLGADRAAEAEHHQPLVLADDLDRQRDDQDEQQDHDADADRQRDHV